MWSVHTTLCVLGTGTEALRPRLGLAMTFAFRNGMIRVERVVSEPGDGLLLSQQGPIHILVESTVGCEAILPEVQKLKSNLKASV